MKSWQKTIKYLAIALAIFLAVSIVGGVISVLTTINFFFGGSRQALDVEDVIIQSDMIDTLEIDIAAAELNIVTGEEFKVSCDSENVSIQALNGKLTVKEKKKYFSSYTEKATITVSLLADTMFEKVSINGGAGKVSAQHITTQKLELDLGAGEVSITELNALKKAEIDGGAGAITINGGEIHNLDLDMGVGALTMRAALSGKSELSQGVGETNITLLGSKDDYCVEVDKGLGDITVDGIKMKSGGIYSNGAARVEIDGGVGEINVYFEENSKKTV